MTTFAKISLGVAAAIISAASMSMTAPAPAEAAFNICKKVKLHVDNKSKKTVRLFDIDYYDYAKSKWRSEPIRDFIMQPGAKYRVTRNLEKVNRTQTKIRVKYRTLKSNGRWDNAKYWYYDSPVKVCKHRTTFKVNIWK